MPSRQKFAYLVGEDNILRAYAFNATTGTLSEIETESILPPSSTLPSVGMEVMVHPSGKFVYGSTSAGVESSLVIFGVDSQTGELALIGHENSRGVYARSFTIDESGSVLMVANNDTDNLVSFLIDPNTGKPARKSDLVGGGVSVAVLLALPACKGRSLENDPKYQEWKKSADPEAVKVSTLTDKDIIRIVKNHFATASLAERCTNVPDPEVTTESGNPEKVERQVRVQAGPSPRRHFAASQSAALSSSLTTLARIQPPASGCHRNGAQRPGGGDRRPHRRTAGALVRG